MRHKAGTSNANRGEIYSYRFCRLVCLLDARANRRARQIVPGKKESRNGGNEGIQLRNGLSMTQVVLWDRARVVVNVRPSQDPRLCVKRARLLAANDLRNFFITQFEQCGIGRSSGEAGKAGHALGGASGK